MQSTKLEKAILEWQGREQPSLALSLAAAEVKKRDYTGAGFYVYLSDEDDEGWDRPHVMGPVIESPQLDYGGGSVFWLKGGKPHCLEIYSFGDYFPENLDGRCQGSCRLKCIHHAASAAA